MKTSNIQSFTVIISGLLSCIPCAADDNDPSAAELRHERESISTRLERLPEGIPSAQLHGRLGFYGRPGKAQWIVVDLGSQVIPDEVVLFPARLPVDSGGDGSEGFPPEIEVEISVDDTFVDAVRLGRWEESSGDAVQPPFLRFPVSAETTVSGRYLRVRIFGSRLRQSGRGSFYTLGEIVVLSEGRNAALRRPVEAIKELANAPRWQAANLTDGYLWCLPGRGRERSEWNGYHSAIEAEPNHRKWVEVVLLEAVQVDELHLVSAHPGDFADTAGFGFPPRFRILGFDAADQEVELFDSGDLPFPNPGTANVMLPIDGPSLQRIRVECLELWQRTGDYIFALSELQVWSRGKNVALGSTVTAADEVESSSWRRESLTDGASSRRELLSWTEWLDGWEERLSLERRSAEVTNLLARKAENRRQTGLVLGATLLAAIFSTLMGMLILQRRRAAASREALRERIAHDLHDELGASLSHLALESDLARLELSAEDPMRTRLMGISETARDTLGHMRDIIWLLAPATDSWDGFQRRIEAIAERILDGVEHSFSVNGEPPKGSPTIDWAREWVMFLTEALTNARRHSGASRIAVDLVWKPRALRLSVQDDGCGFDPEDPAFASGLGMKTYQRRAATLGGSHSIETQPNQGATVHLTAPLPRTKS